MFQETRFDGVLYELSSAIAEHNWGRARAAVQEAREMKVPEGTLQEIITQAFKRHHSRFNELQSDILSF
jgi:hypothetical protein